MKKLSVFFPEGFVSTYFLSILLYCSAFLTVLVLNDQARMQTIMNMQENDAYFQQEAAVVSGIRCRLIKGTLEDGSFEDNGIRYDLDVQERTLYAFLHTEYPETLLIVYDPEKKILTEVQSTRSSRKHW